MIKTKISFLLKKSKKLKNGEAPIYLRVTINGQRDEVSIKKSIIPQQWNSDRCCAKGSSRSSMELNAALDDIKNEIVHIIRQLEANEAYIDSKIVIRTLQKKEVKKDTLVNYFQKHNSDCRNLIGKDFRISTVRKYEITLDIIKKFLQLKRNTNDILLRMIDLNFIRDFYMYLRVDRNCSLNTSAKYLKLLKKVILMAKEERLILFDPYSGFKVQTEKIEKEPLTFEEVIKIMTKDFESDRLNKIRDMFIVACFTGLSFSDTADLAQEHMVKDEEGVFWIKKKRVKTDEPFSVPLLRVPYEIIEKYKSQTCNVIKGKLLPVPANSNYNGYLKEIAATCGITKNLTTHIARHTFATIAYENGIALDLIAKILGQSSTKMTRIYAKTSEAMLKSAMFNEKNCLNQIFEKNVEASAACD